MDKLNEAEVISTAWRALAVDADCEGWRTIPITVGTACRVLAGRHFPGNHEAILVGFSKGCVPVVEHLPEGNGFMVGAFDLVLEYGNLVWFALKRRTNGNLEMFAMMASDIVATLNASDADEEKQLYSLFLGRIRAWQGFMQRGKNGILSPQEEVGLYGELVMLESLLQSKMNASLAIESWYGPFNGTQDFQIGTGAIEVKTTISKGDFIASITSLEQLDENLTKPLFLAGIRLQLDDTGLNLPAMVERIRSLLQSDFTVLAAFETRLIHAGFFSHMAAHYSRSFLYEKPRIFPINTEFPRLTSDIVPSGIMNVRYEINLEFIHAVNVSTHTTLCLLGVV